MLEHDTSIKPLLLYARQMGNKFKTILNKCLLFTGKDKAASQCPSPKGDLSDILAR